MVGPRLPRCSLNYNIPRRVPAMAGYGRSATSPASELASLSRPMGEAASLLFTTNAISFECLDSIFETGMKGETRRFGYHPKDPRLEKICNPPLPATEDESKVVGKRERRERERERVSRVYRRQNAEGLVNGVKYTVVHNEGTLSVPISSRDGRVVFYSAFSRRPRVMGL